MRVQFNLDEQQVAKLRAWQATKLVSQAADGAQHEYQFMPTGLGTLVRVRCCITHDVIDLTDYDSWQSQSCGKQKPLSQS